MVFLIYEFNFNVLQAWVVYDTVLGNTPDIISDQIHGVVIGINTLWLAVCEFSECCYQSCERLFSQMRILVNGLSWGLVVYGFSHLRFR